MPYYFNFVCDKRKDCADQTGEERAGGIVQPVHFDAFHETFGDAVEFLRGQGWKVEGDRPSTLMILCPKHASEENDD